MKLKSIIALALVLTVNILAAQVTPQIHGIEIIKANKIITDFDVETGAEQLHLITDRLANKKIGVIANHTSLINDKHLVDELLALGLNVSLIFTPEHGFRGDADAGEAINNGKDKATSIKIISLYGANKKPKLSDLLEVDILIYDLQDVGVRFYTYISTLYYAMEACSEINIPIVVLDRPNPNGFYVDGPTLKEGFDSFVGVLKIPVVYGMTAGEYAQMVVGESLLRENLKLDLEVIKCKGYAHSDKYQLPIKPSPNLPNMASVYLYPSLCFFEGTIVSVGRGTDMPFQQFGHPEIKAKYTFTPTSNIGARKPKLEGIKCFGFSVVDSADSMNKLNLNWLIQSYKELNNQELFFLENNFIDLLYGSDELRDNIKDGLTNEEIRATWKKDLDAFKLVREKYLLYSDF